jgi:hypothetical protein
MTLFQNCILLGTERVITGDQADILKLARFAFAISVLWCEIQPPL